MPHMSAPVIEKLYTSMNIKYWLLIRKLCLCYFAFVAFLIACDVLVSILVEYGGKPSHFVGCYATDALLVGFECQGFGGAEIVALGLNYPLYHLYMPFFVLWNPKAIFLAIAMYAPVIFFVVSQRKVDLARV